MDLPGGPRGPWRRAEVVRNMPNRLLAKLSTSELRRVGAHLQDFVLSDRQLLYQPGERLTHVYFPAGAAISLGPVMADGKFFQSAMVGDEGLVGASVLLGASRMPGRVICHVGGPVRRMTAADLKRAMERTPALKRLVERHLHALLTQLNQGVACNSLHSIEQRCARWLLMTRDRIGKDSFPLTQQFLASMLGVRRPGVSVAAARLRSSGLIRYSQGHLTIVDARGLEGAACECYGVIRRASQW